MRFLLVGLSRFAKRRVVPAASQLEEIEVIDVASSHADQEVVSRLPKGGRWWADWREALAHGDPGLVYVSLANGDHAAAVRWALERGHHVVVDKPALPDLRTTEDVVSLARSSSLVIAEATNYAFHPVFDDLRSIFGDSGARAEKATAVFTPPVPSGDFRYDPRRGGGALLDTGPYLASLGRVLWGEEPDHLTALVSERTADALATSYSVLAGYPGGRSLVGHFGFTTVYQNSLRLIGSDRAVEVDRIFSALPGEAVELRVRSHDRDYVHTVDPADSMRIFLSRVVKATATASRQFDTPILSDARTRDHLHRAASQRSTPSHDFAQHPPAPQK